MSGGTFVSPPSFQQELQELINKHSIDARTDIPDFILASFLTNVVVDLEHMNNTKKAWEVPGV